MNINLTNFKRFLWPIILFVLGGALFLFSRKTRDRKTKPVYRWAGIIGLAAAPVFVFFQLKKK